MEDNKNQKRQNNSGLSGCGIIAVTALWLRLYEGNMRSVSIGKIILYLAGSCLLSFIAYSIGVATENVFAEILGKTFKRKWLFNIIAIVLLLIVGYLILVIDL